MKKSTLLFSIIISALCITCSSNEVNKTKEVKETPQEETKEETTPVDIEGLAIDKTDYTLVFKESFDSDLSNWRVWNGGAFNQEIQLYRSEELKIAKGILTINTKRQAITGNETPWSIQQKNFEYVSGRIESNTFFGPSATSGENTYIISARMQLPTGHGMWPAFWLYADPWPTMGELDILEARGSAGKQFQFNMFYGIQANKPIGQNSKRTYNGSIDLRNDFHNYELIWQENKVQVALDGQVVITVDANNNNLKDIFGNQLRIVLNTAVGGVFFSDTNSSNFANQAAMKVDWVRVYKK
ncbi:glycoside hydrolase family 16 protein [Wenyingzhuangia sp. IMCC45574]